MAEKKKASTEKKATTELGINPVDWWYQVEEPDEDGCVFVNVRYVVHDFEYDHNKLEGVKSYFFQPREVDAKLHEISGDAQFYRPNIAGKLDAEISFLEQKLKKRLIKYAKDELSGSKMTNSVKSYKAKDYFLEDEDCQELLREAARLDAIKAKVMELDCLSEIKLGEAIMESIIGSV